MFSLVLLATSFLSVRGQDWLPWKMIWDITPASPTWSVASTVTVNSVLHTDAHVKLRVPTFNATAPVAQFRIQANATQLPQQENMTVVAMLDQPFDDVLLTAFANGGELRWSGAWSKCEPGQWIFLNVSSSVSTFYGAAVDVTVEFDTIPSRSERTAPHVVASSCNAGLVIGLSVAAGVLTLFGVCGCVACAIRRKRRNLASASFGTVLPPSGEPSVYLPPAYR
jgi:hypothetical protein